MIIATTDAEILACWPVLIQLRPHLKLGEFLERIRRQQQQGYQLAMLLENDRPIAIMGFIISECLAWGRYMYIYDLVVDEARRSQGYGDRLLGEAIELAKQENCQQLHLDSGVQRFAAHRFYLQHRMYISSHHFCLNL